MRTLCCVLFFWCCRGQAQEPSGVARSIAESHRLYFQAFVCGDSSLFIDRYASDCWIMPPNSSALCGEGAPLEFFREAYYLRGVRGGRFITTDIYGDGDSYVTEAGFFQLFDAGGAMIDNGKFLVLWKKAPAGWKMFRDSFSSDRDQ
jgi:ketosteroid isomerase-like protein